MSGSSILIEFLRWRRRQQALRDQLHPILLGRWPQPTQMLATAATSSSSSSSLAPVGPQLQHHRVENPETFSSGS